MISYVVSSMSKLEKLLDAIINNPVDVRFEDAKKVASQMGYIGRQIGTSHASFAKPGDPIGLNFQSNKNGKIAPYQGRQLAKAIKAYREEQATENQASKK